MPFYTKGDVRIHYEEVWVRFPASGHPPAGA